ncbi:MAG: (2Fe-2S) ferredoxin domain-containing protein [Candidatus Magasanikbacteria bacterium]
MEVKKIEVCCGGTCLGRKSDQIFDYLQNEYKDTDTAVHMCSCLGRCKKGPNILVDDEKVYHYSKIRTIKERIENNEGEQYNRYDNEDKLDLASDFLGDL